MVAEKDELLKKRVLYIGSAVPLQTAEGLDSIQQPLRERYPVDNDDNIEGILSLITIIPTGIQLQYVSDPSRILFFPISSLSLCAAVRCITTINTNSGEKVAKFVSLSNPLAGGSNSKRPAIFTAITRRTEGRKVLECHGFICSSSKDALELVQATSYADRVSKGKVNGTSQNSYSHTYQVDGFTMPREVDALKSSSSTSMGASAEAHSDVRLVGGQHISQRIAPEFYEPPPQQGYFYKTRDSQIKTYAVERVTDGESERLRAVSPSAAHHVVASPAVRVPPPDRRVLHTGSASVAAMTLPRTPALIPVRTVTPVHPTATLIRPRFFSPPPPVLRPRPVAMSPGMVARDPYVFLPPPPNVVDVPYVIRRRAPARRGSDSSSHGIGSSRSSSPSSPRHMNESRRMVNGDGADGSSDVSSRPRTPPTDYERGGRTGPRVSRKEQFDYRKYNTPQHNGDYSTLQYTGQHPSATSYPYDFYVYPPRVGHFPRYPGYMVERARSVPPPVNRGKSKERKKGRKGKKEKTKSGMARGYAVPSDISTDSIGYTSEIGSGLDRNPPRMPRDFRRFENQFKHERAFSKSLTEEGRGGAAVDSGGNAYSLNDHMASRVAPDSDFNLY